MDREDRLAAVIAEWYAARDSDAPLDPEALLEQHPDLADDLRLQFRLADVIMGGSEPETRAAAASPEIPASRGDEAPEQVGAYRLVERLGAGGMGAVYRADVVEDARTSVTGDRVAVKLVHPHLMRSPGFFRRFLREAELGSAVRHANVVRTLDFDAAECDGRVFHFLVMEYVEGETLRELLDDLRRVPEELCRHVGCEIARGLAAIHDAGAVHRDIKPENVLITGDQVVKVMDLGVAHLADEALRLSQTGAFIGSLEYAAPEQFGGDDVDHRIDLHALGLLLYELASGEHPYRADDYRSAMRNVLAGKPRRLGDVNPQISPFFEELVHVLLATDREDRLGSASRLAEILDQGERSDWWSRRARTIRETSRRPLRRIRIPRETNVYGRDGELAHLRARFERAMSGEGQVVLVQGEAGIGKSRLIDELVVRVQADGSDVNFLFGSYPPGGAASADGAFSTAFREHFGEEGLEETLAHYLSQTPSLIPGFAALLRGDAPPADAAAIDGKMLVSAFLFAMRALAAERPTILLIDDLHFAPDDGRALFSTLATALVADGVLLIGTARPGVPQDWLSGVTRLDHVSQVALTRLGPKDLVNLLGDAFRSERLAIDLGAQIAVKSDGNPFFVFEILRGLKEGQFITQTDDGSWVSTRVIDQIHVPSSVLDLVNARVSDLSEDERDLLDVAACCGFEFDPVLVGAALGLPRIPVLKRLGQIERRHRLVRSAGVRYVFDHHQVQEALYASIGELLRREYHRALADAMEEANGGPGVDPMSLQGATCVRICEHLLNATEFERALRYMDPSLTHLQESSLNGQVIDVARRFLAVEGLVEGADRVRLMLRCSHPLSDLGRIQELEVNQATALGLARDLEDPHLLGLAQEDYGWSLFHHSRYEEAEDVLRQAALAGRDAGDMDLEMRATGDLANCLGRLARPEEVMRCLQRAQQLAIELGDERQLANIWTHIGNEVRKRGRLSEAMGYYQRSVDKGRELGRASVVAYGVIALGQTHRMQGDLERARAFATQGLTIARESGLRLVEEAAHHDLGVTLDGLGEFGAAARHFEESAVLSGEFGNGEFEWMSRSAAGYLRWADGKLGAGRRAQEECWTRLAEFSAQDASALANLTVARATMGDTERARELLESSIAGGIFERWPQDAAFVHWAGAKLALMAGDNRRAADAATTGVASLGDEAHRLHLARLLGLHGAALAEMNQMDEARAVLSRSLEVALDVGTPPLVVPARCRHSHYLGDGAEGAVRAYEEDGARICVLDRMYATFSLWRATDDVRWLEEAKRLLDRGIASAPEDRHGPMLRNVVLFRDITAAASEHLQEATDGA